MTDPTIAQIAGKLTGAQRCETCRFWAGRISGRIYTPGACRRYPPAATDLQTSPSNWCGEWQPKPEENADG